MEEFCINDLERNCQNRHFKIALMYCSGSLNLIFKYDVIAENQKLNLRAVRFQRNKSETLALLTQ